ncbi:MAG: hypothetical protein H6Q43_3536 [Deltaproteobacteria bacterium]|jgi:uncharacterized membrane protein YqjE|nr:hypothetical protein [Deltaproteobacteria bacterium]
MQDPDPGRHRGLFASVRAALATLLAIAHTRLELFFTEIEEEWVRFSRILIWGLVGVFFSGLGIGFAVLFFVILLWDTYRLLAIGVPAALFLLIAALAWRVVHLKIRAKQRLFAASLAELAKDREQFNSRS